tara:strand:+ start:7227 stop:7679 length:453 start_codon:yes stop_codon:yes gene_type:complete
MAAYRFRYLVTAVDTENEWGVIAPFIERARAKDKRLTSTNAIRELLCGSSRYILSLVYSADAVVGVVVLGIVSEPLFGTRGLQIVLAVADGPPKFVEALHAECDYLAEKESLQFTRFHFIRKGWKKLLKMQPKGGYKLHSYIAEKDYGRR